MEKLLREGFTEVPAGIGAAMKLFWPVVFVYLVLIAVSAVLGYFAALDVASDMTFFLLLILTLGGLVYVFLALCQGAVGWHRRFLLNEPACWISPVPSLRSLKYALAVFVLILIFLAGHMAISHFTLPYLHSLFTSPLGEIDLTNAPAEQLEIWRRAVWPIQVATLMTTIILTSAILWFGRTWLPIFPYISIRSAEPAFAAIRANLAHPSGLIGALLIVYFLPSILGQIYYFSVPMSVQIQPVPRILTAILGFGISFFCFLWGLSILSLAYRQGAASRMTGTDHAAQS